MRSPSVSCTAGRCAAVGWDDVGLCGGRGDGFYSVPVLGFWAEGLWSLRRDPNLSARTVAAVRGDSSLNGVSCTSPRACTAVGTGVYRWNGRRWSTQRAPIGADELGGVSCTSANACTAVGSGVYSWNGRRWLSVPITDASAADRELAGVSCLSRASCVAVGNYTDGGLEVRPLVESIGMGARPTRQANATAEG